MKVKFLVGSVTVINWSIVSVCKGGNVVIVGVYGLFYNVVDIGIVMNKGLILCMNQVNCKRYMFYLLEYIWMGCIDVLGIISHRILFVEAVYVYEIFE